MSACFHTFWRSSSTYIFNKYRENSFNTYWYYEPYNEALSRCTHEFLTTNSSKSWESGHDFMSAPYYSEYLPFLSENGGLELFHQDFSFQNFFPTGDLPEDEKNYILSLHNHAKNVGKIPVYGFCRSLCRVAQLRELLGGIHFVQYRNPHEMLYSSIDKGLLNFTLLLIRGMKPNSLPARLGMKNSEQVFSYANAIPAHGWDTNFVAPFPEILQTHFDIWLISTIAGSFYADYTFNVNKMCYSHSYRKDVERNLYALSGFNVHFDDIHLPAKSKSPVFDPRMLEKSIDRYIGSKEKILSFKQTLEDISGLPTIQSVSYIEELRDDFLQEYPQSKDVSVAYRSSDTYGIVVKNFGKHFLEREESMRCTQEELTHAHERASQAEQDAGMAQAKAEAAQAKAEAAQAKAEAAQAKALRLQKLASRLQEEKDLLQRTLFDTHNSKSWRLTRPLRLAAHTLRRLKARYEPQKSCTTAQQPLQNTCSTIKNKHVFTIDVGKCTTPLKIAFFSPLPSHPDMRGNQARIRTFCEYLKKRGHEIHFIVLEGNEYSTKDIDEMKAAWDSVTIAKYRNPMHSDGFPIPLDAWYDQSLGNTLKQVCSERLIDTVICSYVFFSKMLELLPEHVFKVIDTHDAMANRHDMLRKHGCTAEWFSCSAADEKEYLLRADAVIALRDEETNYFNRLTNTTSCMTVTQTSLPKFLDRNYTHVKNIGIVASDNRINCAIVIETVQLILKKLDGKECPFTLRIAGKIREALASYGEGYKVLQLPWVSFLGFVDDIEKFYSSCDLLIAPVTVGTGINIKTIQALSFGTPLLATKCASKGVPTQYKEHLFETPEALITALIQLSTTEQALASLAQHSRQVFVEFYKLMGTQIIEFENRAIAHHKKMRRIGLP